MEEVVEKVQEKDFVVPLVGPNDPILREKCKKFDFENPPMPPQELYYKLGATMNKFNGVGLAAPQIGIPYRAFVMRSDPVMGIFNPYILDKTDEEISLEEGCLSFPGIFMKVTRPTGIKVRYTEPDGNVVTKTFSGISARIFQHEFDHLEGTLFTKDKTNLELAMAIKKGKKLIGRSYLVGDLK